MRNGWKLGRTFVATSLALASISSTAATSEAKDEEQLIAKVSADGILFGFARTCRLSLPVLTELFEKQFASSREFALAKVPSYKPDYFRRDFQSGIDRLYAVLSGNGRPAW